MLRKCKLCGKRPEVSPEYTIDYKIRGYLLFCCNDDLVMSSKKKKKLIDNWNRIMEG